MFHIPALNPRPTANPARSRGAARTPVLAKAATLPNDPSSRAAYASIGFAPAAQISPAETTKARMTARIGLAPESTSPLRPGSSIVLRSLTRSLPPLFLHACYDQVLSIRYTSRQSPAPPLLGVGRVPLCKGSCSYGSTSISPDLIFSNASLTFCCTSSGVNSVMCTSIPPEVLTSTTTISRGTPLPQANS